MFERIPVTQATTDPENIRQCDDRACRAIATYWSTEPIAGPPEWPRRLRLCDAHVPAALAAERATP